MLGARLADPVRDRGGITRKGLRFQYLEDFTYMRTLAVLYNALRFKLRQLL